MDFSSVFQYLSRYLFSIVIPLLIGIVAILAIYIIVRLSLSKSDRAVEFKKVIMTIVREPLPVLVIGVVLTFIDEYHPELFPSYFTKADLIFVVKLVLLGVSINAARKISNIVIKDFLKMSDGGRRFFLIGVYSAGLIALFYVVFTSPIRPAVASNAFQIVGFATGIIATYIIAYILNILISRYQSAIRGKQPQLHTTITFARRVLIGVVAMIGAAASGFAAFPGASGAIASLFVAAGFTSIVIGLAAQSSLSNLIAGGVVSIAQPFRIGDALIFNDEYCYVEDIRLIYSTLRTWDGRRLLVPNSMFLSTVLVNYDIVDERKTAIVYMQITLESDLDKAMAIMKDVLRNHPLFYPEEGYPSVLVMGYTEYGVQLRALGRARNQNDNWTLEKEALYRIKKEFQKNGIQIAFPRRDIFFHEKDGGSKGMSGT